VIGFLNVPFTQYIHEELKSLNLPSLCCVFPITKRGSAMLMRPNKDETAVHDSHSMSNLAVLAGSG